MKGQQLTKSIFTSLVDTKLSFVQIFSIPDPGFSAIHLWTVVRKTGLFRQSLKTTLIRKTLTSSIVDLMQEDYENENEKMQFL